MLDKHLIQPTRPIANESNIVYWGNYRVTVLQDRLFRLENSENRIFRDEATQVVFYRDMPKIDFSVQENGDECKIITAACKLFLKANRDECRIEIDGNLLKIDNEFNLKGTYRTLDLYDGDTYAGPSNIRKKEIKDKKLVPLGIGVCSKNGVAVFDDSQSLTLSNDGEVKPIRGDGSDEYIFAYGHDYRSAVRALYLITGNVPKIPRFALGNWWSRYHIYTDKEYLTLLNRFEDRNIPLTVATIDMDWHYSTQMEEDLHISELGKNTPFYGGNSGWTGYTWNKKLFPNYKAFLKTLSKKGLKITLNLHPADGVRWWEDCYKDVAVAVGVDPKTEKWIKFDISNPKFINAYFSKIHKPYEKDGVAFWWIDWQQGESSEMEGLDPLWALNHYHFLDNALNNKQPLILSRYSGIGAHRYPLGFSGDTIITWDTLEYLIYFTATASNVGYTWWSHDIGGHMLGDKDDEMYLRHIQFGVFSPINRLHCSNVVISTKEPWYYGNGAGLIAERFLCFRHKLIPYLYSASYLNNKKGRALIEPLYYEWDCENAYKYKNEYLFGQNLLVAPITQKADSDGYARTILWLPEGRWTDIFTGDSYCVQDGGKEITALRELESIPVFIKAGGILPLSADKGNSVKNPENLEIWAYSGNGDYTLYEDGLADGKVGEVYTEFTNAQIENKGIIKQILTIKSSGDETVVPKKRKFLIRFKDIFDGKIKLYVDDKEENVKDLLLDCKAIDINVELGKTYRIEVVYDKKERLSEILDYAKKTLTMARGDLLIKLYFWYAIEKAKNINEYIQLVEEKSYSNAIKEKLLEIV